MLVLPLVHQRYEIKQRNHVNVNNYLDLMIPVRP